VASCKPSRRWLPAACQGLLRRPAPTDRVVAGPLRSLDQRHGRGVLTPEQLPVGSFSDSVRVPAANAVVPQHLRIEVHLRTEQYPKRRQGAQLIGVKLPLLKALGGRRRYQEAKIRELANELREAPSA
jgi:hypothetical protein